MGRKTAALLSFLLILVFIQTVSSQTVLYHAERLAKWDPGKLDIYISLVKKMRPYLRKNSLDLGLDTTYVADAEELKRFYNDPLKFVLNNQNIDIDYMFARIDTLIGKSITGIDSKTFKSLDSEIQVLYSKNNRSADSFDSVINLALTSLATLHSWQYDLRRTDSLWGPLLTIDTTRAPVLLNLQVNIRNLFLTKLRHTIDSVKDSGLVVDPASVCKFIDAYRDTGCLAIYQDSLRSNKHGINLLRAVTGSTGTRIFHYLLKRDVTQAKDKADLTKMVGPGTAERMDPINFRIWIGTESMDTSVAVKNMLSRVLSEELTWLSDSLCYDNDTLMAIHDSTADTGSLRFLRDSTYARYCKRLVGISDLSRIRSQIRSQIASKLEDTSDSIRTYEDKANRFRKYASHDQVVLSLLKKDTASVSFKSLLEPLKITPSKAPVIVPISLGQDMSKVTSSATASGSGGGISESQAIDAIGTFISGQFEQDLVQSIFQGIQIATHGKRIDYLFPRTFKLICSADTSGMPLNDITVAIRRSIFDDLHTVLDSLAGHKCDTNCAIDIGDTLRAILKIAVDFSNKINAGYTPAAIFQYMYLKYYKYEFLALPGLTDVHDLKVLSRFISFVYTIESAFQDTSASRGGPVWRSPFTFASLTDNPRVKKLFAALLYVQIMKDSESKVVLRRAWLRTGFVDTLVGRCYNVLTELQGLQIAAVRFSIDKKSSTANMVDRYFDSYLDVLEDMTGIYSFATGDAVDTTFIAISRDVFYGYTSIIAGDYSTLLASTVDIAGDCADYYIGHHKGDSIYAKNKKSNYQRTVAYLDRYLGLFVDIVDARSPEDLKNAISRASSESGGFMAKKTNGFKLSIDAYPGLFSGEEYAYDQKPLVNLGFSAPIGLDLTFGRHDDGMLLSVFDFGPIVSYRLGNGRSSGFPSNVTFAQLVSPGLYFKFSPWKFNALTILMGIEVTPELRSISDTVAVFRKGAYYRAGISLTYDVPFFYFTQSQTGGPDRGFMTARSNGFNLSVDAYPGVFFNKPEQAADRNCLAAPVGLDIKLPRTICGLFPGFLVPVEDFPSMIVKNSYGIVASVGLFVHVTACSCVPITVLLGCERNISPTASGSYNRYGLMLSYDIPLFYLVK